MKTSYSWYVLFFVMGAMAMVVVPRMLFVKAAAQQPAVVSEEPASDLKFNDEPNTRAIVVEQKADGTVVQRTIDGQVVQEFKYSTSPPPIPGTARFPVVSADGQVRYVVGSPADPESARLMNEEMQATQLAHKTLAELRSAASDGEKEKLKAQLRERLLAIFELQQKRRAAEVAKIEERLAKLKETMKKRDSAKDSIVDRRLELLTGGVDELGWEETFPLGGPGANNFRTPNNIYGPPTVAPSVNYPQPAPGAELPLTVPPTNIPKFPTPSAVPPIPAAAPAPSGLDLPAVEPRTTPPPVAIPAPARAKN